MLFIQEVSGVYTSPFFDTDHWTKKGFTGPIIFRVFRETRFWYPFGLEMKGENKTKQQQQKTQTKQDCKGVHVVDNYLASIGSEIARESKQTNKKTKNKTIIVSFITRLTFKLKITAQYTDTNDITFT